MGASEHVAKDLSNADLDRVSLRGTLATESPNFGAEEVEEVNVEEEELIAAAASVNDDEVEVCERKQNKTK